MPATFRNILIPVDFSKNTEVSVCRALELADRNAAVHLFHVHRRRSLKLGIRSVWKEQGQEDLPSFGKYELTIRNSRPDLQTLTWRQVHRNIEAAIIAKAWKEKADLVILGKGAVHPWLSFLNTVIPGRMAGSLGCPVLTVRHGTEKSNCRIIVVPVSEEIPYAKIRVLEALCRKFRAKIYLTTFLDRDRSCDAALPLLKTYQWLRQQLHCPIEYTVLEGSDRTTAVLAFAQRSGADILLVHPESRAGRLWPGSFDRASGKTGIEIMTVQPT